MKKKLLFIGAFILLLTSCKTPDPYIYDSTSSSSSTTDTTTETTEEPVSTTTSDESITEESSPVTEYNDDGWSGTLF